MRPRRAASRMMRASPVVSIQPHQGGSVQLLPPTVVVVVDVGDDCGPEGEVVDAEAEADVGGWAGCACDGEDEVFPTWEAMLRWGRRCAWGRGRAGERGRAEEGEWREGRREGKVSVSRRL